MISWLRHQKHALTAALNRLRTQPVSTFLTALAMGVAISLPSGLYLGLVNLSQVAGELPAQPEISIFLDTRISEAHQQAIGARLKQSDIAAARFVPKDKALAALSASQDLADIAAGLTQNPLPDAWVVRPHGTSREELARVADELGKLPGVAETHLDSQWAERLQAMLAIGRNAIRAQVLARRDEILVSRLIGATDRYIRRPFLYLGALQGLFGGLAAVGVLAVAGAYLRVPVAHLADLYGSSFHLIAPTGIEIASVLGLTAGFGWIGAWLSVTRALQQVESTH